MAVLDGCIYFKYLQSINGCKILDIILEVACFFTVRNMTMVQNIWTQHREQISAAFMHFGVISFPNTNPFHMAPMLSRSAQILR